MPRFRAWMPILLAVAWPSAQAAAAGANLTIHVTNVLAAGGVIRLGLYSEALYPDDDAKPIASADVPALAGETVITLHGIAPGIYAIETFQDVNANNRMDTSWLGLPQEPFGFSQDAKPFLSKPAFDDVKFTVVPGENIQVIHLQNSIRNSPTDKARDAIRARQRQ
jgi:uncharacterized protein (DUF2141 family)